MITDRAIYAGRSFRRVTKSRQIARGSACYILRHKLQCEKPCRISAAHAATATMRTLRFESQGKFSWRSVSINYILYNYLDHRRTSLVDIGFDICTWRSSAIFITDIERQTSYIELPDYLYYSCWRIICVYSKNVGKNVQWIDFLINLGPLFDPTIYNILIKIYTYKLK